MNRTDAPALRLIWHNVAKAYGSRWVWRAVAGELVSGEVLVIAGPNGSGKSTLLRLLCGLETPSHGTIAYSWRAATLHPVAMRPFLGLVAPDVAVYRELTALENLAFFAAGYGLERSQAALLQHLEQFELAGRASEPVATFSSGMLLRLKYAVALIHAPPVLLLDEPTAMLDTAGRTMVAGLIAAQRERGITVIATNDPAEVAWGDLVLHTPTEAA